MLTKTRIYYDDGKVVHRNGLYFAAKSAIIAGVFCSSNDVFQLVIGKSLNNILVRITVLQNRD